jgi:hypothetical protein
MSNTERSFWAGVLFILGDMAIYAFRGLPTGLHDLLFHAMPFTLGFALMVPKLFPALMVTVQTLFARIRSVP